MIRSSLAYIVVSSSRRRDHEEEEEDEELVEKEEGKVVEEEGAEDARTSQHSKLGLSWLPHFISQVNSETECLHEGEVKRKE